MYSNQRVATSDLYLFYEKLTIYKFCFKVGNTFETKDLKLYVNSL